MQDDILICQYSGLPSMASYILKQGKKKSSAFQPSIKVFNETDTDRIIQMAWEDRTPFEAI